MLSICLTGGPCAGKSSVLAYLKRELSSRGYIVFTVPEAATSLITSGAEVGRVLPLPRFQKAVFDQTCFNIRLYTGLTDTVDAERTVILYDRGLCDQIAYIGRDAFTKSLAAHNMTAQDVYGMYDAVFHLVSSAKGAVSAYQWNDENGSTGNNAARHETPAEAAALDDKTLAGWIGHPHLRVFPCEGTFEAKCAKVFREALFLLEPDSREIENKYLVYLPKSGFPSDVIHSFGDEITQTYLLRTDPAIQRRVRKRGSERDGYAYYYTEKTKVIDGARFEDDRRIDKAAYEKLLAEADPRLAPVIKKRVCFVWQDQFFELDIYPFDDRRAIMEIELDEVGQTVSLPDFFDKIVDVTGDNRYKNTALANAGRFPDDDEA